MRFLRLACTRNSSSRFLRLKCISSAQDVFTEIYNVIDAGGANYSDFSNAGGSDNDRGGELLTASSSLIGTTIKRVAWTLKKTGSPTGTITFTVRNAADAIVQTFGTLDITTVTTSDAEYTLTAPSSYTLASGDRILVEYYDGTSGNKLQTKTSSTNAFDGTNTKRTSRDFGVVPYTDTSGNDQCGIFYSSNL